MKLNKWLKKYLPERKTINNNSSLRIINNYLRHPNIWRLNCDSIARGTAIGLFSAFIPLPMQMLIAAFLSILFRANLPIATIMTWITNPLTFIPINYFIYRVGEKILGENAITIASLPLQFKNLSFYATTEKIIFFCKSSWNAHHKHVTMLICSQSIFLISFLSPLNGSIYYARNNFSA